MTFCHWEEKKNVAGGPGNRTSTELRDGLKSHCPNLQQCRASDFIIFGFLSADAPVSSNATPSESSSINDISSMSTEQTLASDTDSSLDASTGPLEGCR